MTLQRKVDMRLCRRVLVASICLVIGAMTVTGMPQPSNAAQGPQSRPALTKPTLRLAMPDASLTVDPALVADENNVALANLLYVGLVRLDPSYHVVPGLAARYSLDRNHKTYTFYLRKNLHFSNGDPLTAADIRYSITRSLNRRLKSPSASTYLSDIQGATQVMSGKAKSVSGIKVLNRNVIQITTRWPVPYFLMELTYPNSFALDSKRLSKLGIDDLSWYSNPISSGPYRVKSWTPYSKMVLVPNSHYFGKRAPLKQITISLSTLPSLDLARYVAKSVDVISLPPTLRSSMKLLHPKDSKLLSIAGIYMNFRTRPFTSRNVRRALSLSLPRNKFVAKAMWSTVSPFSGFVPPGQAGYNKRVHAPGFNAAEAKKALKAAGYGSPHKSLPTITLYYADDQYLSKLADEVAKWWRKTLKINVAVRAVTLNTLLARVQSNTLPLYLSGWTADFPDPHDWLSEQWKSEAPDNNVNYRSKRFDNLTSAADVTWNRKLRMKLYYNAQQVLIKDAAWIPLYVPHRLVYIKGTVSNLSVTGYGLIPRGGNWGAVQVRQPTVGTKHKD